MSQTFENEHVYDGILEYDNPLPGWWSWFFILTIIFSFAYIVYYHMGQEGRSIQDGYTEEMAANLKLQFAELGTLKPDKSTLMKYKDDTRWRTVGEIVFKAQCISCHGEKGVGGVGPNLCDTKWKNVKSIEDIADVVGNAANLAAMPAWKNRLHPNELVLVSAYVASLLSSLPAGQGKAPEGETTITEWK